MSQITRFDFTLKADISHLDVIAKLTSNCSKWVFQKEKGESGYEHFQGRMSLHKKMYVPSAIQRWQELLPGIHISATCNDVAKSNSFSYVIKDDTRIDGPWQDDIPIKHKTRQLIKFETHTLYPWQTKIEALCKEEDDRHITIILDEIGNTGKSIFAEYLEFYDVANEVPPFTAMEDLMQCCMCMKAAKAYLIDMPKGMKKDKLASFFAGLEALKNGVMYDKRHAFKKRRIDRPQIVVFTNNKPDTTLLSLDRWKCYQITNDLDMVEVDLIDENAKRLAKSSLGRGPGAAL